MTTTTPPHSIFERNAVITTPAGEIQMRKRSTRFEGSLMVRARNKIAASFSL
jgi:hypothetical protein